MARIYKACDLIDQATVDEINRVTKHGFWDHNDPEGLKDYISGLSDQEILEFKAEQSLMLSDLKTAKARGSAWLQAMSWTFDAFDLRPVKPKGQRWYDGDLDGVQTLAAMVIGIGLIGWGLWSLGGWAWSGISSW